MPSSRTIRRDGEILTTLVQKRQAAAEALQSTDAQNTAHDDLVFSIQAWEMAIRLIAQMQNISRRDASPVVNEAHTELFSQIRCLAQKWTDQRGHIVGSRDGQRMLRYQRNLETEFGERGRPTDIQLTAIIEGREIYLGPVEEEIDIPEVDEGTGPGDETPTGNPDPEGGENGEDITSAVDALLGE